MNALTKNNDKQKVKMTILQHDDIWNFKFARSHKLFKHVFKPNLKENGKQIKWSKIMQAKFIAKQQHKMFFKYLYSEQDFHVIDILKAPQMSSRIQPDVGNHDAIPPVEKIPKCYQKPPGIAKSKACSLKKLCSRNLIPPHHHKFYENLHVADKEDSSENESEPNDRSLIGS